MLTVEPYKSELLPLWRFKNEAEAARSSRALYAAFVAYRRAGDFVGMDMTRKFVQMGYTRARRYANHKSGRKYDEAGRVAPLAPDEQKALAAAIFRKVWQKIAADATYRAALTQEPRTGFSSREVTSKIGLNCLNDVGVHGLVQIVRIATIRIESPRYAYAQNGSPGRAQVWRMRASAGRGSDRLSSRAGRTPPSVSCRRVRRAFEGFGSRPVAAARTKPKLSSVRADRDERRWPNGTEGARHCAERLRLWAVVLSRAARTNQSSAAFVPTRDQRRWPNGRTVRGTVRTFSGFEQVVRRGRL